ncbi:sterol desaturase family protein [Pseudomonas synxantha]|jgi:sterol desaturase/sphingolipid hydroxylase (fatty acid hydroxylase superfamily)|uniref:Sterol desaturase/sphingolipid hydroxylase (Fatty acid hydroxylase superfamily) n=1 Tax=Pseudomonas synxantha TaxID=47883 RepID=A0ACC6JW23_9PSED|nr:sterol desaturase family protein [Pseudomonas synxantha]MDR6610497.1 sterol desaturase/sphingolipid hydroxylase (fatty acid hydroxylase superfamily) [Pseudomonas synxantha]
MGVLATIHLYLFQWVIEPVTGQFLGIFDFNGRLGLSFLCMSYSVAYCLFRFRKSRGLTDARSFGQFIGGCRVYLHRSALLDYRYYFVLAILKVALVLPIVGLVDPYVLRSADYIAFFTNLWGARTQMQENLALTLLYGLGVFLVKDFSHYWGHRAFHSRYLWAFHKVHHSAPVLVPATASRVHFLEEVVEKLTDTICLGAFAGVFWYACGGEISRYTLFGATYMVFIFNGLAANLRHSHVWLSFGPVLERVLSSPAQHQIHHSDAPRHFNKNFGINLSLWDWMFGTLYVTQSRPESIQFGTGEPDHERYLTLRGLIVTPFVDIARKLLADKRSKSPPSSRSDPYFSAQSASVTDAAVGPQ